MPADIVVAVIVGFNVVLLFTGSVHLIYRIEGKRQSEVVLWIRVSVSALFRDQRSE